MRSFTLLMIDPAKSAFDDAHSHDATAQAVGLLTHYSFDLGNDSATGIVDRWLKTYAAMWIRWAIVEALYQGRYKAISVDQILLLWQRRQQPCYHFNYEFERLVCHKFPRDLAHAQGAKPPNRSISEQQTTKHTTASKSSPAKMAQFPSAKSPAESTVLPALPISKTAFKGNTYESPPAWAALAEQIQQNEGLEPLPLAESEPKAEAMQRSIEPHLLDEGSSLRDRVARLQAGVEALIDQATSSLNASAEAAKTRLQHDEETRDESIDQPVNSSGVGLAIEDANPTVDQSAPISGETSDEVHPQIHQFTPAPSVSEFYSKLKAVAEQED